MTRQIWTQLTQQQLLAQCEVDTYRASGPGGQKRNKTSSAVRLRHLPSGLIVIAEESRSQHENKAKALVRMWQAFFLHLREPITVEQLTPEWIASNPKFTQALDSQGKLRVGVRDPRFWHALGLVLDVLTTFQGQVSSSSEVLGITTGNLVDFLSSHPKAWQEANQIRTAFGLKTLKLYDGH